MRFVRIVETLNEPLLTLMKKYLLWICTAAALLAAGASCSDDPEVDSVGRVGIQQESLTADGAGEDLTLNVTSNAYWRINFTDPETGESVRWVTASETSGMGNTAVTLKVARNRSTSARSTYVNVITESESSAVSVLLSQSAGTIGGGDGYDFPISQTFAIDAALALDNAFIEGAVCYFDDGMILRRTGSPTVMEFSTKTHTNPTTNWYFQRGVVIGEWETGDALQLEIPVKEELSGDLRYSYGSRRDGTQSAGHAWVFEWSADGESWTKFDGTCSGGVSDAVWKTIDFTIPADKKIPAGGKLWIRHRCTDGSKASTSASNQTVAYQSAFCITKAQAEPTTVPAMDNDKVVFSTGFDDVIDADLSKTLSGNVTLELEDKSTYTMKTYASASFASTAVPQKRGVVKGLAGASFLLPTSAADLAAMTGTRFGEAVYAITPICGMLKMLLGGTPSIYNATYDDASKTVTYTDTGCTITKLGNTDVAGSGLTCKSTPYDGRFTTNGWGGDNWQDNALLFKIKATSVLKGNLRFGFGLFAASTALVPHNYKIEWSPNNTTWYGDMDVRQGPYTESGDNKFSIPTQANSGAYKMAFFNIPDDMAIAENGYLYIRISQADTECHKTGATISTSGELQFQHAFYLATNEKRAYHTSTLPSGENVLLTEGFDDAFYGHDYFIPTWQMSASKNVPNKYNVPDGWSVDANHYVYELPGYIRVGLDNKETGAGSITTPALTALGDIPADITLTFKIGIHMGGSASYAPDPTTLTVTAEGAGTAAEPVHELASLPAECKPATEAEAKAMEDAYYKWYPVTVKVTGATKDTKITIGGTGRHYIDDIVITKD